ncbi:MAG: glycosyltransferase [Armatimonadetes bacterium]|nr:glycosyltransferase [Armatimonadota bacterium]
MRITIIGPSYPFRGGIAHYTALLCTSMSTSHQVRLVSLSRQYPRLLFPGKTQTDDSAARIAVEGAEPLIDSMNPITWFRAARRIREFAPDLVVIQWWHPFFAPAFGTIARLCRRFSKVLFLCHNVIPHEKSGPVKALSKFAFAGADLFIVHSDEDMANLKSMLPKATVRKARHPTYEVFGEQRVPRAQARKELSLDPDGNVVLFFGLVREYKGLRFLIEAMPKILASVDATLVIAGEFYEGREKYAELIQSLGIERKVRIRDEYIPNEKVAVYFEACDLVVLPYVSATQSGIVQIAYAFDKPVVTTNVGGLPEAVIDGDTGYTVPARDHRSLAEAVVAFFRSDKRDEFAANIREFRKEFSWERMVEAIEELASREGVQQC